jgi:hypothetical protein
MSRRYTRVHGVVGQRFFTLLQGFSNFLGSSVPSPLNIPCASPKYRFREPSAVINEES